MTTASALAAKRQFRTSARDAFANSDTPPGTGESSTVSPESLTTIARGSAAAAAPALSGDLQTSLKAATLPPVGPGQARSGTDGGQRPQTPQIDRGTGRDGR